MSLFGKRTKDAGQTIAILDIENGSVGAALARLSRGDAPKLFAETRIRTPILATLDTRTMSREIEKASRDALHHVSEVAARIRMHEALSSSGSIDRAAVFFSPPWAAMHLEGGTADYAPHIEGLTQGLIEETLGDKRISMHPFGTAAAHGAVALFPGEAPTLLCIINGEVTELLLLAGGKLVGRATMPLGLHSILRTLTSHAGISAAEARSLISLASHDSDGPAYEPLAAAQAHFASEFASAAEPLVEHTPVQSVLVMAPYPAEEWFARALSQEPRLAELFPEGSTVRAMRAQHAMPFIAAHAPKPDLPIMLEALFVDAKFSGIY